MHQSAVGLGSTVAFEQYGQLTIHNRRDNLAAEPLGTFRPHIVGLGTTAQIQIGFTPNAGIVTAYINSVTIGISSEIYTGVRNSTIKKWIINCSINNNTSKICTLPCGCW